MKTKPQAHPIDIHAGTRLRQARRDAGLSQEHIGKAVGITFQQIQKYERGLNRIGASRLFEFSICLKKPIQWFFEGYGILPEKLNSLVETRKSAMISDYWLKITDKKERDALLVITKSLAKKSTIDENNITEKE